MRVDPLGALRSYGNAQLEQLLQRSPHKGIGDFFTDEEIQQIKTEWPAFKVQMRAQAKEAPITFYSEILRSSPMVENFPNLALLIEFMIGISISNASVERIIAIQIV